jgi:hypothetical protein
MEERLRSKHEVLSHLGLQLASPPGLLNHLSDAWRRLSTMQCSHTRAHTDTCTPTPHIPSALV